MAQNRKRTIVTVTLAALLGLGLALAILAYQRRAHAERLVGAWEGLLQHHAGPLMRKQRMVLRIFKEHGAYYAAWDQIDNGQKNLPVTRLSLGGSSVDFQLGNGFTYQGSLNSEATEITGRWKWPGGNYSLPLRLVRTDTPDTVAAPLAKAEYAPRPGAALQGLWKGTLTVGTNSLRLQLKIAQPAGGNFRAELNSLDQPPIVPLPITTMEYRDPSVKFSVQGVGAAFIGQLQNGGSRIAGRWTQYSTEPLTFERADPVDEPPALSAEGSYDFAGDSELQGHWTGTLPGRYGVSLRLVFNIGRRPDGIFSGSLDSPDQMLFAMPFEVVAYAAPNVHLENKTANCVFDGKLLDGKLSGQWVFNKKTAQPLVLERKTPARPPA